MEGSVRRNNKLSSRAGPGGGRGTGRGDFETVIVEGIDFLISQGHSFGEIKKYSFPQFMLFLDLIGRRNDRSEPPETTDGGNRRIDKIQSSYSSRA